MFQAKIVLDSVGPHGIRLTTFELSYPLIVHNEFLTHRSLGRSDDVEFNEWLEFSRNASSNRAIPSSKLIDLVRADPYVPSDFRKSTRTMVAGSSLGEREQDEARETWLWMLELQIIGVNRLEKLGVHKQWRNRPLGPWQWITVVATANGEMWEHFFKLRDHEAAQPDIATVAAMAHVVYHNNKPQYLEYGMWHLPYLVDSDFVSNDTIESLEQLSVARCARTSYLRQGELVEAREDIQLCNDLLKADPSHSCYDDETDVLTYDGWKNWNHVTKDDIFITMNKEGVIEYEYPTNIIHDTYNGDMHHIKTLSVDALVTPNHFLYASCRKAYGYDLPKKIRLEELNQHAHRLYMGGGCWNSTEGSYYLGALIGLYIGDGGISYNTIQFHIRKKRKKEFLKNICNNIPGAILSAHKDEETFCVRFNDSTVKYIESFGVGCKNKRIIREVLCNWGRIGLVGIYDGLMASDGHVSKTGKQTYSTVSYELAGDIQELALKLDRAATIHKASANSESWNICFYRERNAKIRIGNTIKDRERQISVVSYSGKVHCATIGNGVLYVRRNGIPRWCGNSPFEHVAQVSSEHMRSGNFVGYIQLRKKLML